MMDFGIGGAQKSSRMMRYLYLMSFLLGALFYPFSLQAEGPPVSEEQEEDAMAVPDIRDLFEQTRGLIIVHRVMVLYADLKNALANGEIEEIRDLSNALEASLRNLDQILLAAEETYPNLRDELNLARLELSKMTSYVTEDNLSELQLRLASYEQHWRSFSKDLEKDLGVSIDSGEKSWLETIWQMFSEWWYAEPSSAKPANN